MKVIRASWRGARTFWTSLEPDTQHAFEFLLFLIALLACLSAWQDLLPISSGHAVLLYVLGLFYFWPTLAAWDRDHETIAGIFVLNLLLGWTVLGWIVAMVWAYSRPRLDRMRHAYQASREN
jgi:hypothetical protein